MNSLKKFLSENPSGLTEARSYAKKIDYDPVVMYDNSHEFGLGFLIDWAVSTGVDEKAAKSVAMQSLKPLADVVGDEFSSSVMEDYQKKLRKGNRSVEAWSIWWITELYEFVIAPQIDNIGWDKIDKTSVLMLQFEILDPCFKRILTSL